MELPLEILNTLNCIHCGNHLSIFPINLYENGDRVCGRCKVQSTDARRMVTYESVAAFVSFPCKNKKFGCTTVTTPDKLVNHERTCRYKPYDCFENCKWQGMLKSFKSHYEETHKDLVKTTDEFFKHENKDCRVLVVGENDVYLFQLKMKRMGFTADVYLLHGKHASDQYMYKLHFRLVSNDIVNLQKREVKSICEFAEGEGTIVEGINLKKSDSCRIKIVESALSQIELSLSDKFLCKKCEIYRTPPFYECPKGHPVCKQLDVHYCHLCETYCMELKRNSLLDDIATAIQFPCIYPGCSATFLITEQIHHREICRFKTFKCPLRNCKFYNKVDNMIEHLSNKHEGEYFINTMTSNLSNIQNTFTVIQNGWIFYVRMWFWNKEFSTQVVPFGPIRTNSRILFELRMQNLEEHIYIKTSNRMISLPEKMFTGDHSSWVCTFKFIEL